MPQHDEIMGDEQEDDSGSGKSDDETIIENEETLSEIDEEKVDSSEGDPLQET